MLKNPKDEHNFEQLALSEVYKISLDGSKEKWQESAIYRRISFSPDGNYVMVTTVEKPFSYLVPYSRFPSKTTIYSKDGKKVQTVLEVPLIEDLPQGFMAVRTGKRNFSWRSDKPASLIYVEALDGGDPEIKMSHRDEVFQMEAPYNGNAKSILKTINRYNGITWGNDKTAIANDYWWNTRNTKSYMFNPSNASQKPKLLWDRNYQDVYSDPGYFVTKKNKMGSYVLSLENDNAYLIGEGYSEKGQFPFVDGINLKTNKRQRVYQSKYTDKVENIQEFDAEKNETSRSFRITYRVS